MMFVTKGRYLISQYIKLIIHHLMGFFLPAATNGWAAVKGRWMKLPLEPEFEDQAPRMLRNDRDALGNTFVTFTNENNSSLQMIS
ncbi:unnamed protein product [Prunus armeniaca]